MPVLAEPGVDINDNPSHGVPSWLSFSSNMESPDKQVLKSQRLTKDALAGLSDGHEYGSDAEFDVAQDHPRLQTPFYDDLRKKYPQVFQRRISLCDASSMCGLSVKSFSKTPKPSPRSQRSSRTRMIEFSDSQYADEKFKSDIRERLRLNQEKLRQVLSEENRPMRQNGKKMWLQTSDSQEDANLKVQYTHKRSLSGQPEKTVIGQKRFASPDSEHDSAVICDSGSILSSTQSKSHIELKHLKMVSSIHPVSQSWKQLANDSDGDSGFVGRKQNKSNSNGSMSSNDELDPSCPRFDVGSYGVSAAKPRTRFAVSTDKPPQAQRPAYKAHPDPDTLTHTIRTRAHKLKANNGRLNDMLGLENVSGSEMELSNMAFYQDHNGMGRCMSTGVINRDLTSPTPSCTSAGTTYRTVKTRQQLWNLDKLESDSQSEFVNSEASVKVHKNGKKFWKKKGKFTPSVEVEKFQVQQLQYSSQVPSFENSDGRMRPVSPVASVVSNRNSCLENPYEDIDVNMMQGPSDTPNGRLPVNEEPIYAQVKKPERQGRHSMPPSPPVPAKIYQSNLQQQYDLGISGSNTSLADSITSFKKSARSKLSRLRKAVSLDRVDKAGDSMQSKPVLKKAPSLQSLKLKLRSSFSKGKQQGNSDIILKPPKPPKPFKNQSKTTGSLHLNGVDEPRHFRSIGKLKQLNSDGTKVIVLTKPPHGPFGFYIARGNAKFQHGVFVSRLSDALPESFFAGLIGVGDELVEINGQLVNNLTLEQTYDMIGESEVLTLKTIPFMSRKEV